MNCPVCLREKFDPIATVPCGTFDNSYMYRNIRVVNCTTCGHVLNMLSRIELENLSKYYKDEYRLCAENSKTTRYDINRKEDIAKLMNVSSEVPLIESIEHVSVPGALFESLKEDEYFLLLAPDASRYHEYTFFEPYWIILREHIQHFDLDHLLLLVEPEGFKLEKYANTTLRIMSETMEMPALAMLFKSNSRQQRTSSHDLFALSKTIKNYIETSISKLQQKVDNIPIDKTIYFWGIGREFLFLNTFFKKFKNKVLVDNTDYKQKLLRVEGRRINDERVLQSADSSAILIITATAHKKILTEKLLKMNFKGELYDL